MSKRHKINYHKKFVIQEPIQASLIDVNFKLMVSSVTISSQRTTTQENNGAQVGGQINYLVIASLFLNTIFPILG